MTSIPGWFRRLRHAIPLLRGHAGRHISALLDMEWADQLRDIRRDMRGRRPVYTPPQRLTVALPYMAPGSYASVTEVHHNRRSDIHPDVLAATIGRPWVEDDIRKEVMPHAAMEQRSSDAVRSESAGLHVDLPGPVPLATADGDNHRLGEPNLTGPVTSWLPEQGARRAGEHHLPGPGCDDLEALASATCQRREIEDSARAGEPAHLHRTWGDDTGSFTTITDTPPRPVPPATFIEEYAGGDPWAGKGSQDAYLEWLFPAPRALTWAGAA